MPSTLCFLICGLQGVVGCWGGGGGGIIMSLEFFRGLGVASVDGFIGLVARGVERDASRPSAIASLGSVLADSMMAFSKRNSPSGSTRSSTLHALARRESASRLASPAVWACCSAKTDSRTLAWARRPRRDSFVTAIGVIGIGGCCGYDGMDCDSKTCEASNGLAGGSFSSPTSVDAVDGVLVSGWRVNDMALSVLIDLLFL